MWCLARKGQVMTQTQKLSKYNTHVVHTVCSTVVWFHETPVVTISHWTDNRSITLDTGGWFTTTTKTRMNQASNQWKLGYYVYQDKHQWYVKYKGYILPFVGNMVVLEGEW